MRNSIGGRSDSSMTTMLSSGAPTPRVSAAQVDSAVWGPRDEFLGDLRGECAKGGNRWHTAGVFPSTGYRHPCSLALPLRSICLVC